MFSRGPLFLYNLLMIFNLSHGRPLPRPTAAGPQRSPSHQVASEWLCGVLRSMYWEFELRKCTVGVHFHV